MAEARWHNKLGRVAYKDDRDKKFRRKPTPTKEKRTWSNGKWVGEQEGPQCVGYGWACWLWASPYRQWMDPVGIYTIAQKFDEWDGENYEGTSVRAGAKVLYNLGYIPSYHFTTRAADAAAHVLEYGPVVIGVNLTEGMAEPNDAGIMSIDGDVLGGHCMCVLGYNGRDEMFLVQNSWGRDWGKDGRAKLSFADLQDRLDDDGECCTAYEVANRPVITL